MTGSWCDLAAPAGLCQLRARLGTARRRRPQLRLAPSGSGPTAQRAITGIGQGAILSLEGTAFVRIPLAGGGAGCGRARRSAPRTRAGSGRRRPLQLTRNPEPARLQPWPVPFRRPLTAVAPEPGAPVGGARLRSARGRRRRAGRPLRARPRLGTGILLQRPRANGRRRPCAGSPGPNPVAPTRSATPARCGSGRRRPALWEPDPAEPRTPDPRQLHRDRLRPGQAEPRLRGRQAGAAARLRPPLDAGSAAPGRPAGSQLHLDRLRRRRSAGDLQIPRHSQRQRRLQRRRPRQRRLRLAGRRKAPRRRSAGRSPQRVAGLPDGGAAIASLGLEARRRGDAGGDRAPGPGRAVASGARRLARLPDGAGGGPRRRPGAGDRSRCAHDGPGQRRPRHRQRTGPPASRRRDRRRC